MNAPSLTLHGVVRSAADRTPDAPAFLAPGRPSLSYQELHALLETVHGQLRDWGIHRGHRVAVVLPTGPELAAAFVAVASSATCVPLNPGTPAREWTERLSTLRTHALVVAPGIAEEACQAAGKLGLLILDLLNDSASKAGQFSLKRRVSTGKLKLPSRRSSGFAEPEDVALVLQTSGSTGRPKRVPLTHRGLSLSSANTARALGLSPEDRCLNMLSLGHVHGLGSGVLVPLAAGSSVALTSGFNPDQFPAWLKELRPTWYSASPTMHQAILEQVVQSGKPFPRTPLRLIRSGSAPLPTALLDALEHTLRVPVINAYGMTEVPHIAANPPTRRKPGSVGLSVGPEIGVVDEKGRALPATAVGEIVVRGPTVTPGYERNREANAAAFADGWLHTGDEGWLDEDGYLFLTGRLKEMINRGGLKVAPMEIDEILLRHPGVRQAVAFALPHPTLGEDVAAAVVARPGHSLTEAELRDFAGQHLPEFKVPSRIVIVKEIPRGTSEKMSRIGLAERLAEALMIPYEAPHGAMEERVAAVFAEVLKHPRAGRNDNFFASGGDSLRAMQVIARLAKLLHLEIPPATLFRTPTLATLAAELNRLKDAQEVRALAAHLEALPNGEVNRLLDGVQGGRV